MLEKLYPGKDLKPSSVSWVAYPMTSVDSLKVNEFSRTPTILPISTFQSSFTALKVVKGEFKNCFSLVLVFLLISLFSESRNFTFHLGFFPLNAPMNFLKGKKI